MLFRTVLVKKFSGNIYNILAIPLHNKTWFFFNNCDNGCFEILGVCKLHKSVNILRLNNNRHSLLRLTYSEFCSVKTIVFFRNFVEVDFQTVSEFAYCYRNTARTEIVTAFNKKRCLFISEKTLEFTLFGSITLLNFCSA